MTSEIDKLKHFHIGNCLNCYTLLCKIVILKVIKDEEMRNNGKYL